jgi:hypothetical protein
VASPGLPGISWSRMIASGSRSWASATATRPSTASPTTLRPRCSAWIRSTSRTPSLSSTRSTVGTAVTPPFLSSFTPRLADPAAESAASDLGASDLGYAHTAPRVAILALTCSVPQRDFRLTTFGAIEERGRVRSGTWCMPEAHAGGAARALVRGREYRVVELTCRQDFSLRPEAEARRRRGAELEAMTDARRTWPLRGGSRSLFLASATP